MHNYTASEKPWYSRLLYTYLEKDIPELLGLSPSDFALDVKTVEERLNHEGESFLTKTLPKLGKEIDRALQGFPFRTRLFKKTKRHAARPAFLQALTKRIFDDHGLLLDSPDPLAISCTRQVCYWFKKVEKGYSDEVLNKALDNLIEVDSALPSVSFDTNRELLGLARALVTRIFSSRIPFEELRPGMGPGAVAWRRPNKPTEKFLMNRSYTDLERIFRPIPWFFSLRDVSEDPQIVTSRTKCKFGVSRITAVEKDSSGPRIIGLEPAEYMWIQQSLKSYMYKHLESHKLTKGRVNFTSQDVNRDLTNQWLKYDTLDMSSASDRNSLSLVQFLFEKTSLLPLLEASRTPMAVLPDGRLLHYKKFAPMGSAVCFPVEATVFFALAVSSLVKQGLGLLYALKSTFVYGDDLIVPHGYFEGLSADFESVGLKFSPEKCCVNGRFRESCGRDAYDTWDVTPVRLKHPHQTRGLLDFVSLLEHSNALYQQGYTQTASVLRAYLRKTYPVLSRQVPERTDSPPILHFVSDRNTPGFTKMKGSIFMIKGLLVEPISAPLDAVAERSALRVSLSSGGCVGTLPTGLRRRIPLRFSIFLTKKWVPVGYE